MACKGFVQCLLKIINFLLTLIGLAMIGYGIYMVVIWNKSSSSSSTTSPPPPPPPPPSSTELFQIQYRSPPSHNEDGFKYQSSRDDLHQSELNTNGDVNVLRLRRALHQLTISEQNHLSSSFWSSIPSAWFLYSFIAVGVVITVITCSGYIAAVTSNGCCLSCYSVFLGIAMIIQISLGGFIFFDSDWKEVIPDDSTGELESIETFIGDNMKIFRWVALGVIVLQAFALFLAILLRALSGNAELDDSDDEYLEPRSSRQPLLNRQIPSTANINASASDNRTVRADAWSTRMREKYGLDTKEFSYNPSQQQQQQLANSEVKKGWCTIM